MRLAFPAGFLALILLCVPAAGGIVIVNHDE